MPGRSLASCPLSKECSLGLPAWIFPQPGQLVETLSSHGALRPFSCPSLCLLYVTPSETPSVGTQLRSRHTQQPPAPETFRVPFYPLLLRQTATLSLRAKISLMSAKSQRTQRTFLALCILMTGMCISLLWTVGSSSAGFPLGGPGVQWMGVGFGCVSAISLAP